MPITASVIPWAESVFARLILRARVRQEPLTINKNLAEFNRPERRPDSTAAVGTDLEVVARVEAGAEVVGGP